MDRDISLVTELRPALDGHYGIPQETRLLFAALARQHTLHVRGLLQMSTRATLGGVSSEGTLSVADEVHRYARTVVALKGKTSADWKAGLGEYLRLQTSRWALRVSAWFGLGSVRLRRFKTQYFADFIWQHLFSRSLPPTDRECVLACDHLVCAAPWRFMHLACWRRPKNEPLMRVVPTEN